MDADGDGPTVAVLREGLDSRNYAAASIVAENVEHLASDGDPADLRNLVAV